MGFTPTEHIWFNGRLVNWADAKVHVLAHGLHYGTGVFEGLRSYQTAAGPAVFRLDAHLKRFFESAAMYELDIPYSADELTAAVVAVVRENGIGDGYIRPIAFFDAATLAVWSKECRVSVAVAAFPMGKYMANAAEGVRVTISPIRRFDSAAIPTTGKACGQYVNSVRAAQEAFRRGFDEAILLNQHGEVAEGSGENIFVVKGGELLTNDADAGILMGVTRASLLEIARDLGLPVKIGRITVDALKNADELFFCGTAVEVTPIREIDGAAIADGKPGPITRRIWDTYERAVRGELPQYHRWLTYTSQPVAR